jgi:hypothetical protein
MRPYNVYYLPDLWNDWHWFIYDARDEFVAQSDHAFFHMIDAQKDAEAFMSLSMAS